MVLQKQIKLSDYYVKKNGNTISQDGNNVTAANKNVATDGSGNVIFEEKNNHSHNQYIETSAQSNNITSDTGSTSKYPTVKAVEDYAQPKGDYLTNSTAQSTYVAKEDGKGLFSGSYNDLTNKPTLSSFSGSGTFLQISDISGLSNQLDASFKVEVIDNGDTVEYLEDYYGSVSGTSFGMYMNDKNINYDANTIYLLPSIYDNPSYYNEYILVDDSGSNPIFELLGTTQIDLSNYISKQANNSNILLANGTTIAQSSFIPKGSTEDIQLANGSTTPTTSFATSGHNHDSTYIPLSARKATVTSGDTTGVPTGDAVQKAIDATLDNIITQLRS